MLAVPSLAYLLPDTDQRTCYQDVVPYLIPCEGTGQDGAYIVNPLSYTDNSDGTVTDNNTGLIWQQQDDGAQYNWYRATGTFSATYNPESADVCGSLILGDATDWRLPTKNELLSIVDYEDNTGMKIRTAYFLNAKASSYWTSTRYATDPQFAWVTAFNTGYIYFYHRYTAYYVRCVRGGS